MKMRREEVSKIRLSPQFAHDLIEAQFGKNAMGSQTQRQEIANPVKFEAEWVTHGTRRWVVLDVP